MLFFFVIFYLRFCVKNQTKKTPQQKKNSLSQVTYVQDTTLKCDIHVETKHLGACWKNSGNAVEVLQARCHSDSQ